MLKEGQLEEVQGEELQGQSGEELGVEAQREVAKQLLEEVEEVVLGAEEWRSLQILRKKLTKQREGVEEAVEWDSQTLPFCQ